MKKGSCRPLPRTIAAAFQANRVGLLKPYCPHCSTAQRKWQQKLFCDRHGKSRCDRRKVFADRLPLLYLCMRAAVVAATSKRGEAEKREAFSTCLDRGRQAECLYIRPACAVRITTLAWRWRLPPAPPPERMTCRLFPTQKLRGKRRPVHSSGSPEKPLAYREERRVTPSRLLPRIYGGSIPPYCPAIGVGQLSPLLWGQIEREQEVINREQIENVLLSAK
ncbi:MAG: hypothetical protein GX800_00075 [Clostridiaceae bacterium]|nr:hypothetical protein [Clostridiaceae bacterium]